ncbi:16479_t:CDS:2 [Funneliformis geosporum]|uniref:16479_t:CDS:1 n=1 Tax=Funneliformis geosporum TaxID=1117311 RepID=A0A9W4SRW3_9GLOM|nr:16479_t:CDS:2 [Funneliformis geosporum]
MTILLAGHGTTSIIMNWALYQLAKHPHEQDKLREELVKAFPDKSKFNPNFDEINSLEYLNCVVKETFRLNPAVSILQRTNIKDMIIGGQFVPKGSTIDIPIATLQKLPSIWGPTADNFDPKRWLDSSLIKVVTNYNYMPFGTGVRSCIGNKIALSEFKVLLGMLVRNFVFRPVEGFDVKRKPGLFGNPDSYVELFVSNVEV